MHTVVHVGNGKGKIFLVSRGGQAFYHHFKYSILVLYTRHRSSHLFVIPFYFFFIYVHVLFLSLFLFILFLYILLFIQLLFISLSTGRNSAHAIPLIDVPLAGTDEEIGLYD